MMQADIYLVPFPFSDLSGTKVRPVLVMSKKSFNTTSQDLIVCAITSVNSPNSIRITQKDLTQGVLYSDSYVKYASVFKLDKKLLCKKIGTLHISTFDKIRTKLLSLF